MKPALLYPLLAFAAIAVWLRPDHPAEPAAAGMHPPGRPPAAHLDLARTSEQVGGEAALPRAPDGHYYADVNVNGMPAHMLVDTGASVVALTGQDAEAVGLHWEPSEVTQVATGANGPVFGVRKTLDQVQLGDLDVHGVNAIVVPDGLPVSLLGQSFLSRIGKVEIADGKMVLGE